MASNKLYGSLSRGIIFNCGTIENSLPEINEIEDTKSIREDVSTKDDNIKRADVENICLKLLSRGREIIWKVFLSEVYKKSMAYVSAESRRATVGEVLSSFR